MASRSLMETAQAEMRPHMDDVIKDVGDARNSLASDADRSSGLFMTSHDDADGDDAASRHLQRLLDIMSYVPERVAKMDAGKYVTQRKGFVSYIYMANKS